MHYIIHNKEYILIFRHIPSPMGAIVNFKPGQLKTENNRGAKVHPAPPSNGNNWLRSIATIIL